MSSNTVIYNSENDKSSAQALQYSRTHDSSHRFLAYRDIPALLKKYSCGEVALDYGTGTGYSAQFLLDLGFNVTGVDVSKEMLFQAQQNYPHLPFHLVENKTIPFSSDSFDVIFSSFVLFEIGKKDEIISYLKEAKRVLKKGGVFIGVTGSAKLHSCSNNWVSFNSNFPQNLNPKSGDIVKLYHYESDMEFTDYYWTEEDYRDIFFQAGFHVEEIHYPLGNENEPYIWKDERNDSPFVTFVVKN